jgi:RNA polymerase-binding transcription factor DksA
MDSKHAKKLLTEQLTELDERERRARTSEDEQVPEQGALGQHPADNGSDLTNEMERELVAQTISWERQQILDTLERIETGTYGRVPGRR